MQGGFEQTLCVGEEVDEGCAWQEKGRTLSPAETGVLLCSVVGSWASCSPLKELYETHRLHSRKVRFVTSKAGHSQD